MFQSLLNVLSSSTGVEPVIGCDQVATWSTMRNLASVSLVATGVSCKIGTRLWRLMQKVSSSA